MMFSDVELAALSLRVRDALSSRRYAHTLGVVSAAKKIAHKFNTIDISEIVVSALLHDITKEYSVAEHKKLVFDDDVCLPDEVLHSFSAPSVIKRDYAEYATSNVLRSVYCHTVGDPDMTLFDEIIFIADYVEDGRTYPSCVSVRQSLYSELQDAKCESECEFALHRAVIAALSETVKMLTDGARPVHPMTQKTLDAMLLRIEIAKG